MQRLGNPKRFKFLDHGDPSTLIITQYRYNFPLGALAQWDEYDRAYIAQKQRYGGEEVVPIQPHHVDLPPVRSLRNSADPILVRYFAWGKSLGLIGENDQGLWLQVEGIGSQHLGATEAEALRFLSGIPNGPFIRLRQWKTSHARIL